MKVIERYDTKTYVQEQMFHWIKDENEVRNIFEGVDPSRVITYARVTDPVTFQPLLYFVIRHEDPSVPLNYGKFYVTKIEYMA